MDRPPHILNFSATDPTGGAGMTADIMTQASLGCHGLSVITGVSVQNTSGVESLKAQDADYVDQQARTILSDIQIDAIKCGLLCSAKNIQVIAKILKDYPNIPVVIDPIISSGRGDELSSNDMNLLMLDLIFPIATIVTPNSLEAKKLASDDQQSISLDEAALRLLSTGAKNILITGTHEDQKTVINRLYQDKEPQSPKHYHWERLPGNYHGSGCTLASSIAAYLSLGFSIAEAAYEAQQFTWDSLKNAYRSGAGQLTPNRFFWMQPDHEDDDEVHH